MNRKKLAVLISALALACSGSSSSTPDDLRNPQKLVNPPTSKAAKISALYEAAANLSEFEKKVPHYFGPFPNWANSPLTLPDAQVTITDPSGKGSGATAEAVVGAGGAVTAINVLTQGSNYSSGTVVTITGGGSGAKATPRIDKTGTVSAVRVTASGGSYTAPSVVIRGGNGSGAAATAYGRVDKVNVTVAGSGFTFPTVDFDMPDFPDGVRARGHAICEGGQNTTNPADWCPAGSGKIVAVAVDDPGSGYAKAPNVVIRNGTLFDPKAGSTPASATATLSIGSIILDSAGTGYEKTPVVIVNDATFNCDVRNPPSTCATATASIAYRGIGAIQVTSGGSGYVTKTGIQKFVDTLPGLGPDAHNNLGQYIPVAAPDTTTYPGADYYEIAVVEYAEQMHSSLPPTKLRGYVQLQTDVVKGDPKGTPITLSNGRVTVDKPHYLGPTIVAQRNRAVRVKFYNLLPTGAGGDLFLPVDSTMMGSGMADGMEAFDPTPTSGGSVYDAIRNPVCTGLKYQPPATATADPKTGTWSTTPKDMMCFKDNRATLHLHGGNTPWISDGTPHQWLTPAAEDTQWKRGVSAKEVPDMVGCAADGSNGCMTFYWTNQQSARLMFYHDHSWGITRLNVYAGEAAGYVIQDETEKSLVSRNLIPADQIPLIIQDRTFVPGANQLSWQDPTWDTARWGGTGSLWQHHVYMPAQNPGDPSGMSPYGRWMYGPWFWPPATDIKYLPIANPYFDPNCRLDDSTTWQYQTDPFCEPPLIPSTPNISVGMEQFNDTPVVNGTAYPTVTLQPKAYRFRILNAANDRFWNLQWYVADASGTEVALNAAEVAAAQLNPTVFPTPDTTLSPLGPNWIQIGSEGGFLPAPAIIPPQPITWITDPTRFDFGNVDKHSLAMGPAERADVIVDFSAYAGKTLILYNDAPAAYPARIPSYDYYTGAPDLTPVGAPKILPGYGPNTRTIMQVKIGAGTAQPFDLKALQAAFRHQASGGGVFESGQHPIIVGQAAYNSAYGTSFAASGDCNTVPNAQFPCDGIMRISQQGGNTFTFDTLMGGKVSVPIEPKAIHDEMNSTSFDPYGRMQATLGVEAVPATPGLQNVNLFPYVMPPTEVIDTTYLPRITFDANGAEMRVTPITVATDGTQIWKITHNGVDTHPVHFHAFDVQVINRVTWDNIVIMPDANELGWKDTVKVSPLEDTIFALRPVIPNLPWELPNSIRQLDPMRPVLAFQSNEATGPAQPAIDIATQLGTYGKYLMASATIADPIGLPILAGPNGEPIDVYNHIMNFGAEYVYHCHILSHEEMDMMRPVILAYPPKAPGIQGWDATAKVLTWRDNSIAETAYSIQVKDANGWREVRRFERDLSVANGAWPSQPDAMTSLDTLVKSGDLAIRVVAENKVGDWWDYGQPVGLNEGSVFPTATAKSASAELAISIP